MAEGTRLESLISCHAVQHFFSDPSHILPNTASCNELIFTCQSNSIVYCGVPLSLHSNCYHQNHQIVNWVNYMFNFKFVYSLPCECVSRILSKFTLRTSKNQYLFLTGYQYSTKKKLMNKILYSVKLMNIF